MQQAMQVWMKWIEDGCKAGWLLDGGDALRPDGRLVAPDTTVTDGPFAESKELVSGYSMIEADDYDAAVAYAKTSPMITEHHGYVEVRQLAEVAPNRDLHSGSMGQGSISSPCTLCPSIVLNTTPTNQLVEHFFRHEYAKLVAMLSKRFGFSRIELIEDCVAGAMAQAMDTWNNRAAGSPGGLDSPCARIGC